MPGTRRWIDRLNGRFGVGAATLVAASQAAAASLDLPLHFDASVYQTMLLASGVLLAVSLALKLVLAPPKPYRKVRTGFPGQEDDR